MGDGYMLVYMYLYESSKVWGREHLHGVLGVIGRSIHVCTVRKRTTYTLPMAHDAHSFESVSFAHTLMVHHCHVGGTCVGAASPFRCMSTSFTGLSHVSVIVQQCSIYGHNYHYTPYSARMSPENTHKLMGIYMEVVILGVIL